jgi:hypothetical protein
MRICGWKFMPPFTSCALLTLPGSGSTGYYHVIKSGESRYGHGDILAVPGVTKDGAGVSIEFTIVPLRDGADRLIGLAAIMRDVTKRFEEIRVLKQKLAEATKAPR